MSEAQSRVPQEAEGHRRSATDSSEAHAQRTAERKDVDRAEVGQFAAFDVAPDLLDGIQFWGLSGNLDLKHSFETQGAGPNPQQGESNAREN